MAENGTPDDSISILDDISPTDNHSNGIGIPQFHIVTGRAADVGDASHYALNQACQSLQKKNRELEQQLFKLQREHQKYRRKRITSQGERIGSLDADMSLSPPNSNLMGRGVVPESTRGLVGGLSNGISPGSVNPQEEFIQYLQKELEREQLQRRDISNRLDEEKAKTHKLEQKVRGQSEELTEAVDIVTSRREEIERLNAECDKLSVTNTQLMGQIRSQDVGGNDIDVLKRQLREIQGEQRKLEAEHTDMQQMYEDNIIKTEELEGKNEELRTKCCDLEALIKEKDVDISRLSQSNQQMSDQIKSLADTNDVYQRQLERERRGRTSEYGDLVAVGTTVSTMVTPQTEGNDAEDTSILENTSSQISGLRQQVRDMQNIIQEQSSLIRDLGSKIRQRSQSSLASSVGGPGSGGSATPPLQGPHQGARPKTQGHNSPPLRQHSELRASPDRDRKPVACAEDLESISMGTSDHPTLIEVISGATSRLALNQTPELDRPSGLMTGMNRVFGSPPRSGLVANSEGSNTEVSSPVHQQRAEGSSTNPQVAAPRFSFQAEAGLSNTEPIVRLPPTYYNITSPPAAAGASSVSEPLIGDNRLNPLSSSSTTNRHITIEQNLQDELATPPGRNNQNQNINLQEMLRDKYVEPSGGESSNNPFVASKHVPARNIYTEPVHRMPPDGDVGASSAQQGAPPRTCPVCSKTFPLALSQEAFENHVHYCLNTSALEPEETSPTRPPEESDLINNPQAERDVGIYECPVCNALQPPGTTENQFLAHVDAHFADENFEVVQP